MLPTWQELRIALRTLRRSKAFATFSILALALAITANTTMSSLIDGLVFPEVGFPDPGQLYVAHFTAPRTGLYTRVGIHDVLGGSGRTYSGATSWIADGPYSSSITVEQRELHIPAVSVGGTYFRVLGSHPLYGSLFRDSTAADRQEAVISERLWRRISGGKRTFAPFAISLTGGTFGPDHAAVALTVIGVIANNGAIPANTDLFIAEPFHRSSEVLLRLRHGVSQKEALTELDALAPNIDPAHNRAAHFTMVQAALTPARNFGILIALVATTLAVLLIACANIANLLLARGMARSRELATRIAFGASRWQVARLLFAESGLIAAAGGVLGLLLSVWTVHLVRATLPAGLQYYGLVQPQLSWRVLVAGVGFTVVAAVVFGIAPAIPLMRAQVGTLIKGAGSRRYTESGTRFRWLVVIEVAGALTLVVSATMLGAAASRVHLMDLGYNATNLISASVNEVKCCYRSAGYGTAPDQSVISKRRGEMQGLRDMHGVAAVTAWWYAGLYPMVTVDDPGGRQSKTIIGQAVVREVSPN
ncbi:MAG: FtsX-like permease family protein, partial [Gemmatimonadaceae bacterium]